MCRLSISLCIYLSQCDLQEARCIIIAFCILVHLSRGSVPRFILAIVISLSLSLYFSHVHNIKNTGLLRIITTIIIQKWTCLCSSDALLFCQRNNFPTFQTSDLAHDYLIPGLFNLPVWLDCSTWIRPKKYSNNTHDLFFRFSTQNKSHSFSKGVSECLFLNILHNQTILGKRITRISQFFFIPTKISIEISSLNNYRDMNCRHKPTL